ncbi:MAG: hypothetical protein ACO1SX_08430 [Actinomycetota bacterium]
MPSTVGSAKVNYSRILALEIDRRVAEAAEDIAEEAQRIARNARDGGPRALEEAQINGLAAAAITARSVAEIDRFIERQTARREAWEPVGPLLRGSVKTMQDQAKNLGAAISEELKQKGATDADLKGLVDSKGRSNRIHLRLVQELVSAFTADYRYRIWEEKHPRPAKGAAK